MQGGYILGEVAPRVDLQGYRTCMADLREREEGICPGCGQPLPEILGDGDNFEVDVIGYGRCVNPECESNDNF